MSVSLVVRSVRAAVFAVVCVLLAVGGHALATGGPPPVWVDAACFLPVFAASCALAGRERSLAAIGAAMLAAQSALHLAFDAVQSRAIASPPPDGGPGSAGPPGMGSAMGHGTAHGAGMSPGHGMRMAMAHTPHAMTSHAVAAHLVAALLASWCLRRGEAALWSLLRRAGALVPGLVAWWRPRTLPVRSAARRTYAPPPLPACRLLLRHALSRRGPPARIPYAT
ncbi:hypothetical protein [Streptomyces sp. NPDC058371]|uniref:hypothetical protein n=1 Tax=Streptomyces sp. NPDC058371 TaxID=3346463 RepID=UPI00364F4D72